MRIAPSTLPAEDEPGLGVISDTFIPKYTWLGEYDGEIVESDLESEVGDYAWSVSIIVHLTSCSICHLKDIYSKMFADCQE